VNAGLGSALLLLKQMAQLKRGHAHAQSLEPGTLTLNLIYCDRWRLLDNLSDWECWSLICLALDSDSNLFPAADRTWQNVADIRTFGTPANSREDDCCC